MRIKQLFAINSTDRYVNSLYSDAGDSLRFAMARLRVANTFRDTICGVDATPDFHVFRNSLDNTTQIGDEAQITSVDQIR